MSRGAASVALVLIGALLTVAGGVLLYVRAELVDEDAFSSRAVDALHDDDVRRVVVREVAAQLASRAGVLPVRRADLEATLDRAVRTPSFERAFRAAASETHAALFEGGDEGVFFDVPNAGRALAPSLSALAPGFAELIPAQAEARLLQIERRSLGVRALRLADDLGLLGALFLLAGLAVLAGGVSRAADRRAALARTGLALGLAAALVVMALVVFEEVVAANARGGYALAQADVSPAVKGVWSAYAGDLTTWALAFAVLGLAAAAALAWPLRRSP